MSYDLDQWVSVASPEHFDRAVARALNAELVENQLLIPTPESKPAP